MKKRIAYLTAALCLVLAAGITLAWILQSFEREGNTDGIKIADPPLLYVLDSDTKDMTQIDLQDLRIGEEKQVVFCVSSVYPIDSNSVGYKGSFSLEIAYTNNLYAEFNLYPAELVGTDAPDDMTNIVESYSQAGTHQYFKRLSSRLDSTAIANYSDIGNKEAYGNDYSPVETLNQATYKNYISGTSADNAKYLQFEVDSNTGLVATHTYFVLDITWPEGADLSLIDAKETDLVYIMAKGGYSESGGA